MTDGAAATRLECRSARVWPALLIGVGGLALVCGCAATGVAWKYGHRGAALVLSIGTSAALLAAVWLFSSQSRPDDVLLAIDERGIHDVRGVGLIGWSDVTDIWIGAPTGERILCVGVRDPERYWRRVPRVRRFHLRSLSRGPRPLIPIRFQGLDVSLADAVGFLQAHHLQRIARPPPRRPSQALDPPRWELR